MASIAQFAVIKPCGKTAERSASKCFFIHLCIHTVATVHGFSVLIASAWTYLLCIVWHGHEWLLTKHVASAGRGCRTVYKAEF